MTDYLAILLEEQVWEDEEKHTSLELPPEGGMVWKKRRVERTQSGEKEEAGAQGPVFFPPWAETEKSILQQESAWAEKESLSGEAEASLLDGGARLEERMLEVFRRESFSGVPLWTMPRYRTGSVPRETRLYSQLKMGQTAVAYARQRGNMGGMLLSRTEPEEGGAPLPVGELDRLVERDARRYDGAHPLY